MLRLSLNLRLGSSQNIKTSSVVAVAMLLVAASFLVVPPNRCQCLQLLTFSLDVASSCCVRLASGESQGRMTPYPAMSSPPNGVTSEPRNLTIDEFMTRCKQYGLRVKPWSDYISLSYSPEDDYDSFDPSEDDNVPYRHFEMMKIVANKNDSGAAAIVKNPISKVFEHCQSEGWKPPAYTTNPNGKLFRCCASVTSTKGQEYSAFAEATTKKEAKTLASKQLMENIESGISGVASPAQTFSSSSSSSPASSPSPALPKSSIYDKLVGNASPVHGNNKKNMTQLLHEICAKTSTPPPTFETSRSGVDNWESKANVDYKHRRTGIISKIPGKGSAAKKKAAEEKASEDLLRTWKLSGLMPPEIELNLKLYLDC